jgi:hypothetical protein
LKILLKCKLFAQTLIAWGPFPFSFLFLCLLVFAFFGGGWSMQAAILYVVDSKFLFAVVKKPDELSRVSYVSQVYMYMY